MELEVDGVLWGAFGASGQRCTAASRVIVHEKILPAFEKRLVERVERLRLGSSLDETVDMGPTINASRVRKVENYAAIGKDEGARLVHSGRRGQLRGVRAFFLNLYGKYKKCV